MPFSGAAGESRTLGMLLPRPWSRPVILAVIVVLVASSTAFAAAAAATSAKPVVLTSDQIGGALLTLDDLPSGWIVLPTDPPGTHGYCGAPSARGRAEAAGMSATASVTMAGDQNVGPFLDNDAYEFPSSAAAKQFVQSTARAVIGCHHMDE